MNSAPLTPEQAEHLNLLAIFHYVVGGLLAVCSLFPLIHLVMGILFLTGFVPVGEHASPNDVAVEIEESVSTPLVAEEGDEHPPVDLEGFDQSLPKLFGVFFVVVPSIIILCGEALALCIILTGRYLHRRIKPQFCLVVACVECIFMPFGTVLGILTIMLLSKTEVKRAFGVTSGS